MPVWTHAEEVVALEQHVSALRTKLALREQQLRESDAALAAEKAKVDDLRLVAVRADMQRMALSERLGSAEPETAPELWEAIVTAAIRWRRGADRGELAAAVDAFIGERDIHLANVIEPHEPANQWQPRWDGRYGYVIVCGMRPFSDDERRFLIESLSKSLPTHWTPEVVSMPGFEDAVYKVLTS